MNDLKETQLDQVENADEQINEEELNTSEQALAEDDVESEVDDEDIDYKAELEKVKSDSENYKEGMLTKKIENKDLKQENEELKQRLEEVENSDVRDVVKEELNHTKLSEMLSSISNEDERELVQYHYENSIKKSGQIDNDFHRARVLANAKKIERDNKELRQAMISKSTQSNASIGNNQSKPKDTPKVKLGEGDKTMIKRINERRIANGKKALSNDEIANILNN